MHRKNNQQFYCHPAKVKQVLQQKLNYIKSLQHVSSTIAFANGWMNSGNKAGRLEFLWLCFYHFVNQVVKPQHIRVWLIWLPIVAAKEEEIIKFIINNSLHTLMMRKHPKKSVFINFHELYSAYHTQFIYKPIMRISICCLTCCILSSDDKHRIGNLLYQ